MNILRAMEDHGHARLAEIDAEIAAQLRTVRALYAERVAVSMHLFIASIPDHDLTEDDR
jgi:hypothetical protein